MALPDAKKVPSPPRETLRYAPYRDLIITYEGNSLAVPVRVPDLSPKGMFINTSRAFPEGTVMKVRFRLTKSGTEVKTRAEVRYCLPGVGIGVMFLELSPEAKRAIEGEMALPEVPESLEP